MKVDTPEKWKDIPGFGGRYQASTEGRIRRTWEKSGKTTLLMPWLKIRRKNSNSKAPRVRLTRPDGSRVERSVLMLVAETFYCIPEGKKPVHKNGIKSDCTASNIMFMTEEEMGKRFGADSARRPVTKIDAAGEIVECYSSAREAARNNYLSYQTVLDRCNGKVKKEFALDGYSYRWDD